MVYDELVDLLQRLSGFAQNQAGGPCEFGCNDMPGGFQDLNPVLFTLIGEIAGIVMSENMPLNVQNAVGNWFELLGQVILTYSAQQQYFQAGPGRFYNPIYKNVSNPFCQDGQPTPGYSTGTSSSNENNSSSGSDNSSSNIYDNEINDLKETVTSLIQEVQYLRSEINILRNNNTQ